MIPLLRKVLNKGDDSLKPNANLFACESYRSGCHRFAATSDKRGA
jgi:hypothetical protein